MAAAELVGPTVLEPLNRDVFDLYRCNDCGYVFTRLEELTRVLREGSACRLCGSRKYRPAAERWWHLLLPRIWVYWFRVRRHVTRPEDVKQYLLDHGLL